MHALQCIWSCTPRSAGWREEWLYLDARTNEHGHDRAAYGERGTKQGLVVAKVGPRSILPSLLSFLEGERRQYADRETRESVRGQRSLKEMKAAAKCVLSGGAGAAGAGGRAGEWGGKFALHLSREI